MQLGLIETWPLAIDFSSSHRTTDDEHCVGMAMIGAAIPVFPRRATEFGHADYDSIFAEIAQVGPEGGQRAGEIAQHVGQLALGVAFIHVVVPASDVSECNLYTQVGFN